MKMRVLALLALLAVCSGTRIAPLLCVPTGISASPLFLWAHWGRGLSLHDHCRGEGQDGTTIVDLGGQDWRVASSNGSISAAASVPGVIHLDLLVRPPSLPQHSAPPQDAQVEGSPRLG